ncbi:MAG: zeta toxin family protein [Clostridia bacterium]|nr:zeta toxin family protein [Clostridia bacterium]
MKRLLIITGDLAVGKSRFAGILSKRYGAVVMYKDKIKEVLGDTIGFADREENLRLSVATMSLMTYGFEELSSLGEDVILEANFKSHELEKLHSIATEKGYKVLTLVMRAEMDIIYKRFVNRIENENRHPVHISGFDGYDSLKYYIEKGRAEHIPGEALEINANDFGYQSDERVLSLIDEFMGK